MAANTGKQCRLTNFVGLFYVDNSIWAFCCACGKPRPKMRYAVVSRMESLGDRIYRLRRSAGLSQEELADRVDVSRQAVTQWETGSAYPKSDKIILLCHHLHTTADYLLTGIGDEKSLYNGIAATRGKIPFTVVHKVLLAMIVILAIVNLVLLTIVGVCATTPTDGHNTMYKLAISTSIRFNIALVFAIALVIVFIIILIVFIRLRVLYKRKIRAARAQYK